MTAEIAKSIKQKKKREKVVHEEVPVLPPRKSRRLQGQKPEFVPEGMFQGEARPYIPPKSEKEQLLEIEGAIVDCLIVLLQIVL